MRLPLVLLPLIFCVVYASRRNSVDASLRRWGNDIREELNYVLRVLNQRYHSFRNGRRHHTTTFAPIEEPSMTPSTTTTSTTSTTSTTTPTPTTTTQASSTTKPPVFFGEKKLGMCPPPIRQSECSTVCLWDDECIDDMKCCTTQCGGTTCMAPVTERAPKIDKPGECPPITKTHWICSSRCSSDADCRGEKKCCRNRCGANTCIAPQIINEIPREFPIFVD